MLYYLQMNFKKPKKKRVFLTFFFTEVIEQNKKVQKLDAQLLAFFEFYSENDKCKLNGEPPRENER